MAEFKFFSTLQVAGNCKKCKARIENALRKTPGIYAATWDVPTKTLSLHYDYSVIKLEEIKTIIASLGHDVEEAQALNEIYDILPESCQYRKNYIQSH